MFALAATSFSLKCSSAETSVSAISFILIITIVKDSEHFFPLRVLLHSGNYIQTLVQQMRTNMFIFFPPFFFFFQRYANPESHLRAWCQCVPSFHIWGIVLPSPSLIKVPASKQPVSHNGPIRLQRVKYSISFSVHESLSAGYDQLGSVVMNGGRRKWKLQELPGVTGGWNILKAKWTIAY